MTSSSSPTLTVIRRALQPLFNALDDVDASAWGRGVVLAVSGGPDSRALLEAFARWPRRPAALEITVVVVDHGRRAGSAVEAAAVVVAARALDLRARVEFIDVVGSDEATLRNARYGALQAVAREEGRDAVVVAHHEGDVAEGLLLHLTGQGGGRQGRSPRPVEVRTDGPRRIRPFLQLPKSALRAALTALGIEDVVVDEDDLAGRNARGRLRLQILEPLGAIRGGFETALARHARLRAEDDEVLDGLVPDDEVVTATLPPALLRRWLQRRIAMFAKADPRTSPAAIDAVIRLARSADTGEISLRGCRAVIRAGGNGRVVAVERDPVQSRRER